MEHRPRKNRNAQSPEYRSNRTVLVVITNIWNETCHVATRKEHDHSNRQGYPSNSPKCFSKSIKELIRFSRAELFR